MEIRLGWAVVAGIALGGAVAWWELGHPGWQSMDQKLARAGKTEARAERPLYRWRDGNGVLQITDKPPKGRTYQRVHIREDQNIVPMSPPAHETPKKPGAG